MSLPAQVPVTRIVSAGGQTVFVFNFRCDDSTLIVAYVGNVLQGGPVVALNADQTAAPGGTVTLAAQAAGAIVTIERVSPQTQTVALTAYGAFAAATIMAMMDRVVMMLQEVFAKLSRSLQLSRNSGSTVSSIELPDPIVGYSLMWIDDGAGGFKIGNGVVAARSIYGELATDSGDHTHLTLAHAPAILRGLYRNGQRIFSPGDFTLAGNQITLVVALDPVAGEKLNADYDY